jgi:hypothetical protein
MGLLDTHRPKRLLVRLYDRLLPANGSPRRVGLAVDCVPRLRRGAQIAPVAGAACNRASKSCPREPHPKHHPN